MEHQEHITGALSAWMEDLLPALNILGNTKLDDQVFTTTGGLLEPRPPPGAVFPRLKPGQGEA